MKLISAIAPLLMLTAPGFAQPTHVPDIGGFATRVDLSELPTTVGEDRPAPALHYYPTNSLSRLPASVFADALLPATSNGIHQIGIPSARWLVLPDASHADTDVHRLLEALPPAGRPEAGPLEIRLHADNKFSLALAIGDAKPDRMPAGLDLSPGTTDSWLACRIPSPSSGRTDPQIMAGVQRLRRHAASSGHKLHTGDLMLIPYQPASASPDYLLCMRIVNPR